MFMKPMDPTPAAAILKDSLVGMSTFCGRGKKKERGEEWGGERGARHVRFEHGLTSNILKARIPR